MRIPDTEVETWQFLYFGIRGNALLKIFSKVFFQPISIGLKTSNDHLHSRVKQWNGSQL